MRYLVLFFLYLLTLSVLLNCNQGLSPEDLETTTGIKGTISYTNNWPPADSIRNLRVVVFKNFPPQDILVEILTGEAFVYPPIDSSSLQTNVPSEEYFLELPEGTYAYIAVAQQYGDDIFNDWRSVGQYDINSDSLPSPVVLEENTILEKMNIFVDFENLPIQPF